MLTAFAPVAELEVLTLSPLIQRSVGRIAPVNAPDRRRVNGVGPGRGQAVLDQILARLHGIPLKSGSVRSKSGRNPLKSCVLEGTGHTLAGPKRGKIRLNPSDPICVRPHFAGTDLTPVHSRINGKSSLIVSSSYLLELLPSFASPCKIVFFPSFPRILGFAWERFSFVPVNLLAFCPKRTEGKKLRVV